MQTTKTQCDSIIHVFEKSVFFMFITMSSLVYGYLFARAYLLASDYPIPFIRHSHEEELIAAFAIALICFPYYFTYLYRSSCFIHKTPYMLSKNNFSFFWLYNFGIFIVYYTAMRETATDLKKLLLLIAAISCITIFLICKVRRMNRGKNSQESINNDNAYELVSIICSVLLLLLSLLLFIRKFYDVLMAAINNKESLDKMNLSLSSQIWGDKIYNVTGIIDAVLIITVFIVVSIVTYNLQNREHCNNLFVENRLVIGVPVLICVTLPMSAGYLYVDLDYVLRNNNFLESLYIFIWFFSICLLILYIEHHFVKGIQHSLTVSLIWCAATIMIMSFIYYYINIPAQRIAESSYERVLSFNFVWMYFSAITLHCSSLKCFGSINGFKEGTSEEQYNLHKEIVTQGMLFSISTLMFFVVFFFSHHFHELQSITILLAVGFIAFGQHKKLKNTDNGIRHFEVLNYIFFIGTLFISLFRDVLGVNDSIYRNENPANMIHWIALIAILVVMTPVIYDRLANPPEENRKKLKEKLSNTNPKYLRLLGIIDVCFYLLIAAFLFMAALLFHNEAEQFNKWWGGVPLLSVFLYIMYDIYIYRKIIKLG